MLFPWIKRKEKISEWVPSSLTSSTTLKIKLRNKFHVQLVWEFESMKFCNLFMRHLSSFKCRLRANTTELSLTQKKITTDENIPQYHIWETLSSYICCSLVVLVNLLIFVDEYPSQILNDSCAQIFLLGDSGSYHGRIF